MALLAVLGAFAPPASAMLSLDNTTDTSITIDADAHWFAQSVAPQTVGNHQFIAYWDAENPSVGDDAPLKITRRRLSDDNLQSVSFDGSYELTDPDDGHNQLTMGLSPIDGRIHISWSTHNNEHHYVQSSSGCMTQATLSSCTWTHSNTTADADHESTLFTYPKYINDRDGNLYLTFRYGKSRRGDQYLHVYDNDGTWTSIGRILHGRSNPFPDPPPGSYEPAGVAESTQRGPYMAGLEFDRNNRLHMMWTWREDLSGIDETWLQRGAFYAYSDDYGTTWKNNAGTAIATAGTDAITVTDSGLQVITLDYGSFPLPTDIELDSHNNPHMVMVASDTTASAAGDANLRQLHLWRSTDGTWFEDWIEPSGGNSQWYELGSLTFDRGDVAYYVYNDNKLGWRPWNENSSYQDELRWDHMTWQGGDYLHIKQMSSITALVNNDRIDIPISTSGNKQFRVRMRNNTEGNDVILWWTTDAAQSWDAAKSQTFSDAITTNDGSTWKEYTFTITDADWTGNLRDLEFNPIIGTTAQSDDSIDIDWIRITDASGNIAKAWEFDEGSEIVAAEAAPTANWANWSIEPLLPGVSAVWGDSYFNVDKQLYANGTGDSRTFSFPVQVQGSPLTESLTLRDFDVLGDTTSKYWGFDVDAQGWITNGDISGFGWQSDSGAGSIGGTITGNESRIYSLNNLKVKIDCNVIHVRLKNTSSATTARVWFITDDNQTFNTTKSKTFSITPNSGYTEYTIDMTSVSGWSSGKILRRLRIDPSEDAGVTSGSFLVHRVYIAPS